MQVPSLPLYKRTINVLNPIGRAANYTPFDGGFRLTSKPSYQQLSAYDEAARKEPVIKQGLEFIVLSVVNKLGSFEHSNKDIEKFINNELENRARRWIANATYGTLKSGFNLGEILYKKKQTQGRPVIGIDDIINYHSLQSMVVLNDNGRVVDGEKVTNSIYKSGFWIPLPPARTWNPPRSLDVVGNYARLPENKRWFTNWNDEGNNPWGHSILESVLPYHLFKEAFRDMMLIALDRYGTPIVYAIVPGVPTGTGIIEPDGTERMVRMDELAREALANISSQAGLVFTKPMVAEADIEVGVLTTGNNFSDSFERALNLCDTNMMIGLGIPNLLLHNRETGLGTGRATEIQVELFDGLVSSIFDAIVQPFVNQVIRSLIDLNFDSTIYKDALEPGRILRKPTRANDITTIVDAFDKLIARGIMSAETDKAYIRNLMGIS